MHRTGIPRLPLAAPAVKPIGGDSGSLFAYGGTRFAPRRQIGAWSPQLISAAADPGGLAADTTCCGYGIADGQPLIFIRNLQKPEERSGYPYSVFLRFSADFWQTIAFNPHRALDAVLRTPELCDKLLYAPESVDMAGLEAEVLEAASRTRAPASGDSGALALLLHSAFQPEPLIHPARRIAESPGAIASQVADGIAAFPAALRLSLTWTYGNSARLASLVQSNLHLTLEESAGPDVEARMRDGARLGAVVKALSGHPDAGSAWRLLDETTIQQWASVHGQDPAELAQRLLRVGDYILDGDVPSGGRRERLVDWSDQRPLAAELRQLFQARLTRELKHGQMLDNEQTVQIVRTFTAAGEKLAPAIARSLDPDLTARELFRLDRRPDEIVDSPDVNRSYYLRALKAAADPIDAGLLRLAIATGDPEVLAEAAFQTETYLDVWLEVLDGFENPEAMRKELQEVTRRKLHQISSVANSVAYVLFGNDPGGAWLSRIGDLGFRLQTIRELVRVRRGEYPQLKFSSEVLARVDDWLDHLRAGPLGRDLPLDLMSSVAHLVGGRWKPFLQILAGNDFEAIIAAERDVAERERLEEDFARHMKSRKRPPAELRGAGPERPGADVAPPSNADFYTTLEQYCANQNTTEQVVRSSFPRQGLAETEAARLAAFLRKPEIRGGLIRVLGDYSQPVSYFRSFFAFVFAQVPPEEAVKIVRGTARKSPRALSRAVADELSLLRFPEKEGLMKQLSGIFTQTRGKPRGADVPQPLQSYCRFLATNEGRKFQSQHLSHIDNASHRSLEELLRKFTG